MSVPHPNSSGGSSQDLEALVGSAVAAGVLSNGTAQLISGNLGDLVLAGAAGQDLESIEATDVTLVTVLLDKSSSIAAAQLEPAVRTGYNLLLDTFASSQEADSIMVALWTFDHDAHVVHSYLPVNEAATLNSQNYRAGGATHLYDTWCDALAANVAYAQRLRDAGTPTRSIVCVITDGEDVGSRRRIADCARLSRELLASEQFVLAMVGVGDAADFRSVGRSMGIPDASIAVQPQATGKALREVFELVSRSVIQLSGSQVRLGPTTGFFGP